MSRVIQDMTAVVGKIDELEKEMHRFLDSTNGFLNGIMQDGIEGKANPEAKSKFVLAASQFVDNLERISLEAAVLHKRVMDDRNNPFEFLMGLLSSGILDRAKRV